MAKRCLIFFVLSLFTTLVVRANVPPLLIVGNDSISKAEFLYLWNKHNSYKSETKPSTIREFLQSYIDYRLKVLDAKAQGLDKQRSFLTEYQQYRDIQLTPYFLDSAEREQIYHEAYERMLWEISASHILLNVPADTEDSLIYNRAMELRTQILKGASFDSLARAVSEDPSAKENGGNLGFFCAFTMVEPFERAAFATPVDSVSMPIRTTFGYHIIQVNDRRPARGKMQVSNLVRYVKPDATPQRVKEVYDSVVLIRKMLEDGKSFMELVQKYSSDTLMARMGGFMLPVSAGRYPAEITEPIFSLKEDGDVTQPIRTRRGWHLFSRLRYYPVGSYEQSRTTIRDNLRRSGIDMEGHDALVKSMLERQTYEIYKDSLNTYLMYYFNHLSDTTGAETYKIEQQASTQLLHKRFARVGKEFLKLQVLDEYIKQRNIKLQNSDLDKIVLSCLEQSALTQCENEVRKANPTLDYLLNEFYDGLLLFDISERKLWQVSPEQEKEYKKIYKRDKKKLLFTRCLTAEEYSTKRDVDKLEALRARLCSNLKSKVSKKELARDTISFRKANYEAGISYFADYGKPETMQKLVQWEENCSRIIKQDSRSFFLRVVGDKPNVRKSYDESRGELQRIYQEEAEVNWLQELRAKYRVEVDEAQFKPLEAL